MARYLSAEWFEEVNEAARANQELSEVVGGVRLVLQQVVIDGPSGDIHYAVRIEDGTVTVTPGDAPDADVTVTEDHDTAAALHRGELRAAHAFMTGRIRVTGNTQALLGAQAALHRLDAVFASVREGTTCP
ncbi:MAG TPA: SCP2 sterol-binding domain-containing protein [Acidimicrobiales bacterium]|nr:SCP2 sterol-binding domain-containing protein [Acidimicrobiales bacterium]